MGVLVPLLVIALTYPPAIWPYSAGAPAVTISNSLMLSMLKVYGALFSTDPVMPEKLGSTI